MTQAVIDGAAAAGAKLVFADNLYVYGPPDGPMTEETPQRAQGKKGRTRKAMADAVMGAPADGRLRCTIGRSSAYYGPRGTASTVGENIMKPALRGRRARWLGSSTSHTRSTTWRTWHALVTLGERDEADGGVWHLPAGEPLTGRQFLALVFGAAGQSPRMGVASRPMIRIAGLFSPFLRELGETLYQFERTLRFGRVEVPARLRAVRPDAAPGGREAHGGVVPATVRRLKTSVRPARLRWVRGDAGTRRSPSPRPRRGGARSRSA
jgi:hypothetical protein